MTNKEIYSLWVVRQVRIPIFMQPWWLDAVCAGKKWDVLLFFSAGREVQDVSSDSQQAVDEVIGAMPYLLRERLKMKYVIMPQLTQIGGIWIDEKISAGSETNTQMLKSICSSLQTHIDGLDLHYYYQQFSLGCPLIPYIDSKYFKIKQRRTYRIENTDNLEELIAHFSKNVKRQLQKSLSLHADWNMTAEEFYTFHNSALRERRRELIYSREFFLILQQKTFKFDSSCIIAIKNQNEETLAAVFVVWDKTTLYYLIPSYHPLHKNSGASALLVLEAIKLAQSKKLAFDFEGGMNSGIAKYYKQFSSTECTYYSVEKVYKFYFRIALFYNWMRSKKLGL